MSEERQLLRETVAALVDKHASPAAVREAAEPVLCAARLGDGGPVCLVYVNRYRRAGAPRPSARTSR